VINLFINSFIGLFVYCLFVCIFYFLVFVFMGHNALMSSSYVRIHECVFAFIHNVVFTLLLACTGR